MASTEALGGVYNRMDHTQSFFQNGTGHADNYMGHPLYAFFGEPNGNPQELKYANQYTSMYTLPDVYKGRNQYLGEKVLGLVLRKGMEWQTDPVHGLPFLLTQQKNFSWTVVKFNDPMVTRVPELAPTRVVRSSQEQKSATVERWGLGLHLEHGFWKTPEGRRHYVRSLQQIQLATLRTISFNVITALVQCREQGHVLVAEASNMVRPDEQIIANGVRVFASLQKKEYSADHLIDQALEMFQSRGVTPNTLAIPRGVASYLRGSGPLKTDYQHAGPDALKARHASLLDQNSFKGLTIKYTAQFRRFDWQTPMDALVRVTMVGDYMQMLCNQFETRSDTYSARKRDIFIYDAQSDSMRRISLRQAAEMCVNAEEAFEDATEGHGAENHQYARQYGQWQTCN